VLTSTCLTFNPIHRPLSVRKNIVFLADIIRPKIVFLADIIQLQHPFFRGFFSAYVDGQYFSKN
jgi:hypothetical protein